LKTTFTVARWPKILPNNSQQVPTNCPLLKNIDGKKFQNLAKGGRKEAGN
jgi:hypothetical protein